MTLDHYLELVTTIALDDLPRENSLPLLVEHVFSFYPIGTLLDIWNNGPKPHLMVADNARAIAVVFDWMEKEMPGFADFKKNLDKSMQDKLWKWRSGEDIPGLQSISEFGKLLHEQSKLANQASAIKQYLLVARAIDWFASKYPEFHPSAHIRQHIWLPKEEDIGLILSGAKIEYAKKYKSEVESILIMTHNLRVGIEKKAEDKEKSMRLIQQAREQNKKIFPNGSAYFINWHEGRWHIFAGELEKALSFYKKAFEGALYNAGKQQMEIIREALVLAAKLVDRPFLKRLKNQAVAFGMFNSPGKADPLSVANEKSKSKDHIVEDWEVEQWAGQFHSIFPAIGWFPGVEIKYSGMSFPGLVTTFDDEENRKPDLRSPDRKIAVGEFGQRRYPQLVLCILENKLDDLDKLLQKDASVDVWSDAGDTPILVAVQEMNPTNIGISMDRRYFDLIAARPHKKETLNRATVKKKLTPLTCAVYTHPFTHISNLL
jgi:hypothetical protein